MLALVGKANKQLSYNCGTKETLHHSVHKSEQKPNN
jgi:hypothetical protein